MAVHGLGCPVRFTLTGGQKGDAPQAAALIEGLPAEVIMADTAYDADPLRQAIAAFGFRNYGDRDKGPAPLSLCESRWRYPMIQVDDLSCSLIAFEQISTLVIVVELSQSSWLTPALFLELNGDH
jgi:hypothetical protein